jgi:hypothetical protein
MHGEELPLTLRSAGYGQDSPNQQSRCNQHKESYPSLLALTIHSILISKAPTLLTLRGLRSPVSICR